MGVFKKEESQFNIRKELRGLKRFLRSISVDLKLSIDQSTPQYLLGDIQRFKQTIFALTENTNLSKFQLNMMF